MKLRYGFSKSIRRQAIVTTGLRCAMPFCRAPLAPFQRSGKFLELGPWISHINAAASGGPRWDAALSPEAVRAQGNTLATCPSCGALIDKYPDSFQTEELTTIREEAIARASWKVERNLMSLGASLLEAKTKVDIRHAFWKEGYNRAATRQIRVTIGAFCADERQRIMETISRCLLDSIDNAPCFSGLLATILHVKTGFWTPPSRLMRRLSQRCRTMIRSAGPKYVQVIEPLAFALALHGDGVANDFLTPFVLSPEWSMPDFRRILLYAGGGEALMTMIDDHLGSRQGTLDITSELGRFVKLASAIDPREATRMAALILASCHNFSPRLSAEALLLICSKGVQVE